MNNRIKDTIRRYAAMALSLTVVICFCFIGTPGNIFATAADSSKELSKEEEALLVKSISDEFVSLNSKRNSNLEMASKLANEIFFKKAAFYA